MKKLSLMKILESIDDYDDHSESADEYAAKEESNAKMVRQNPRHAEVLRKLQSYHPDYKREQELARIAKQTEDLNAWLDPENQKKEWKKTWDSLEKIRKMKEEDAAAGFPWAKPPSKKIEQDPEGWEIDDIDF